MREETASTFSVIIPSYESKKVILNCLESLARQTYPGTVEIIVVHSSDDDVPQLISAAYPEVIVVHMQRRCYPGEARNIGLRMATQEIVAFLDAHNEASETWLFDLNECFRIYPKYSGFGGSRVIRQQGSIASQVHFGVEFMDFTSNQPERSVRFVPGGNSAFRRKKIGDIRFDENLRAFEDVQFCLALAVCGCKIRFMPHVKVFYHAKQEWNEVWPHIARLGYWSGIGRSKYSMLGRFLFVSKVKWFVVAYRWSKLLCLTLRCEPKRLFSFLSLTPFYVCTLYIWVRGFQGGIASARIDSIESTHYSGEMSGGCFSSYTDSVN